MLHKEEMTFNGVVARLIPGSSGYYASKCGRVFSVKKYRKGLWKELNPVKDKYGYLKATVKFKGKPKIKGVHRWVCYAHYGISDLIVNHINFNREDNRIENLEYVTHKQNSRHSKDSGRLYSGHQKADDCKVLTVYTLAMHTDAASIGSALGFGVYTIRNGKTFSDFFDRFSIYSRDVNFSKIFGGGYWRIANPTHRGGV